MRLEGTLSFYHRKKMLPDSFFDFTCAVCYQYWENIGVASVCKGLGNLRAMEYPGRVIIIGRDRADRNYVVLYAITGRSPSSQSRKLVVEGNTVWTEPVDEKALKSGKRDLLIYPAICIQRGIAVSNGKQTEDIRDQLMQSVSSSAVLHSSLMRWSYEPDAPHFTPRISGCILPSHSASLSTITRASDGSSLKRIYDVPLIGGKGKLVATYRGEDRDPLPSFQDEPLDVEIEGNNAEEAALDVYQALAPKKKGKDYRVAVACVFTWNLPEDEFDIHILHRQERF